MSASMGDVFDIEPRQRRRRAERECQRIKEHAARLAADSEDGEWWATRYLLAAIREQAREAGP